MASARIVPVNTGKVRDLIIGGQPDHSARRDPLAARVPGRMTA